MKNLLLTSAVSLALAGPVYAQSNPVLSAVEAAIAGANENDANISYSSADVGDDNSVTLTDFRMAPDDGEAVFETDFVKLTPSVETPGDVTVTMADALTVTVTPPSGQEPLTIDVATDGFALNTNYLLGASGKPTVSVVANSILVTGGHEDHPMLKALNVHPENLAINFAFDETTRNADAGLSMSALAADYTIVDPTGSTIRTAITSEAQTISFTAKGLPDEDGDPMSFFMGGGSFALNIEGGASTTLIDSNSPNLPAKITGRGGSGSAEIAYNQDGFVYRLNFGEVDYTVEPDPNFMPFPPMQASMSSGSMELVSPVMPSGEVKDILLGLTLKDLVLSDSVWSMIDPGATIPRDPATLEIDIDAAAELAQPIFMLEGADNPMEVLKVESVDIQKVFLSAGGAKVEAGGAMTLDNSGPIPMPNGAVDISVAGVQGLAQKLVDLGLIEQMQVGMVMGMMMAFAQPGTEPDTFSSKIEFKDGGIFANGQQIQ
jgi:uncharacterized protein DUF2125